MEEWQLDFEWLRLRHKLQAHLSLHKKPDLNSVLLLVGIQELGQIQETWTKEEKQDLMHVAVCELLSPEGYYIFEGRDDDGWPHYKKGKPLTLQGVKAQETLIKKALLHYFKELPDLETTT